MSSGTAPRSVPLERGIEVLRLLGPQEGSLARAPRRQRAPKPTLLRILHTLERAGWRGGRSTTGCGGAAGVDRGAERAARSIRAWSRPRRRTWWRCSARCCGRPTCWCTPRLRDGGRRAPAASGLALNPRYRIGYRWTSCSPRPGGPGLPSALRPNARSGDRHWRAASPPRIAHGGGPRGRDRRPPGGDAPAWLCGARRALRRLVRGPGGLRRRFRRHRRADPSPMTGCARRSTWCGRGGDLRAKVVEAHLADPRGLRRGDRGRARVAAPALSTAAPSRSPSARAGALQVAFHGVEVAAHARMARQQGVGGTQLARGNLLQRWRWPASRPRARWSSPGLVARANRRAGRNLVLAAGLREQRGQAEACAVERGFALQRAAQALLRHERIALRERQPGEVELGVRHVGHRLLCRDELGQHGALAVRAAGASAVAGRSASRARGGDAHRAHGVGEQGELRGRGALRRGAARRRLRRWSAPGGRDRAAGVAGTALGSSWGVARSRLRARSRPRRRRGRAQWPDPQPPAGARACGGEDPRRSGVDALAVVALVAAAVHLRRARHGSRCRRRAPVRAPRSGRGTRMAWSRRGCTTM